MCSLILVLVAAAVLPGEVSVRAFDHADAVQPAPRLVYPNGLAILGVDQLLISDIGSHSILRCDADGQLTIIAGAGRPGFSGDGGPAAEARLNSPFDVLVLERDGAVLIADTYNHRIRRIDRAGQITTIAGNGRSAYAGDGGPATEASLQLPQSIAVDSQGNLFIADTFNHVVRRVDTKGVITTVAGSEPGLAGDGGPATKAQLNLPMAVTLDPQDRLYISDAANSRIRRVNEDGTIETVAGFGQGAGIGGAGFDGDDGPPARAKLFSPADVAFDAAGNCYIADSGNNRIRVIREEIITTLAGDGTPGSGGDGGPAIEASLKAPQKIAVRADGTIFIADRANHRIRAIDSDGRIKTLVEAGTPDIALRVGKN
jgi:sugar lactone lactonase YvrE